jgi:TldD protein
MKVQSSPYLTRLRPVLCELLGQLQERYAYASVLATDVETKSYSVSRSGIRVAEIGFFGKRGFMARVWKDGGYAEYSANSLKREDIEEILKSFDTTLEKMSRMGERFRTPLPEETPASFVKATDYETDPREMGDEEIVKKLEKARLEGLAADQDLIECSVSFNYQIYHKVFLSKEKDLEQNVMFTDAAVVCLGRKGEELKDGLHAVSLLGGAEILDRLEDPVEIFALYRKGDEDAPLTELLDQYAAASDQITWKQVDPALNPALLNRFTTDSVTPGNNTLIVSCAKTGRFRILGPYSV